MTIQEAIDYINAHTWSQWKLGLSRTRDLLALLGNPQKKLRFVHVAGSNPAQSLFRDIFSTDLNTLAEVLDIR